MFVTDCTGSGWPLFIPLILGILTGFSAFAAWFRPDSLPYRDRPAKSGANEFQLALGYTRESVLWGFRIGAAFLTVCFGVIGIALLLSGLRDCGGLNLHTGFTVRYWPPMFLFIVTALAFAIYWTRKTGPKRKAIHLVLVGGWSFAASQAAAFHTGSIADTWGTVAFSACIVLVVIAWRWRVTPL